MKWLTTLKNMEIVAGKFWKETGDKKIFAFHGEMGAGKTTFIHALCRAKGVHDVITSPTFSLINEYRFAQAGKDKRIYHMDLYRIKDEEEAAQAGIEDCLNSGDICLVEWPGKASSFFDADTVHVFIEAIDPQTRRIQIADK
jgi:ATPase, YjeE family